MTSVLMVDDAELFRILQQSFLNRASCEIVPASGAEDVLARARSRRPDLVVMNRVLPDGSDGLVCCGELKGDRSLCDVPVLLIGEQLPAGVADAVVSPPPTRDGLLTAIRHLLPDPDRRARRRLARLRVHYFSQGAEGTTTTTDVAVSGLFLRTRDPMNLGQRLQMIFDLEPGATVRASGNVVRRVDAADPRDAGVGVQFAALGDRDRQELTRFVEAA